MNVAILQPERGSLTSLIGWVSLCLLAAGWSPADASLRQLWTSIGLFGLVSAIGLDMARRMQGARVIQQTKKQALKRFESSALALAAQDSNLREIKAAIHEIVTVASCQQEPADESFPWDRVAVSYPIEIQPLMPLPRAAERNRAQTLAGELVNVSEGGVGIEHNLPLECKCIRMSCGVLDGAPIRMIVDLQWRNGPGNDRYRYASGGRIVEIESSAPLPAPTLPQPKPALG